MKGIRTLLSRLRTSNWSEIVAVLFVFGILLAVAVPKFITVADEAREKALSEAVGKLKGRVNQYFALRLKQGESAGDIAYTASNIDIDLGSKFEATITSAPNDDLITGKVRMLDGSERTIAWSMKRPGK